MKSLQCSIKAVDRNASTMMAHINDPYIKNVLLKMLITTATGGGERYTRYLTPRGGVESTRNLRPDSVGDLRQSRGRDTETLQLPFKGKMKWRVYTSWIPTLCNQIGECLLERWMSADPALRPEAATTPPSILHSFTAKTNRFSAHNLAYCFFLSPLKSGGFATRFANFCRLERFAGR